MGLSHVNRRFSFSSGIHVLVSFPHKKRWLKNLKIKTAHGNDVVGPTRVCGIGQQAEIEFLDVQNKACKMFFGGIGMFVFVSQSPPNMIYLIEKSIFA